MVNKETADDREYDERICSENVFEPGSIKKLMKKQSQYRRNLLCKLFKCDRSQLRSLLGYEHEPKSVVNFCAQEKIDSENGVIDEPAPIYTDSSIFSKVHETKTPIN